ncbi:serine hydrolase domain-containing protein [Reyranella sp.]|uniref:serine hydrolase domain-containing protein n=1 Tax=Reyranella sp. TaxID=1929291 RepID=UPI003782DFB3
MMIAGGLSALAFAGAGGRAADMADWPVATPESQGIDKVALDAILDPARILNLATSLYTLRSLVVVRNGFLVEERYYAGSKASTLRNIASITKSISSILVGIALEQGKIRSLDQTIAELLPEAAARAPASAANGVTLAQLLTQTGGFPDDRQSDTRDLEPQVRDVPLEPSVPPVWRYSSAAVSLIAPILAHAVGGSVEDFARASLFSPLGIGDYDYDWRRDAAGNVRSDSGLRLRTRDLARLAWTMADGGRWRGRQVVPAQWVAERTRRHIALGWPLGPMTNVDYGYLWFTGTLHRRVATLAWGYGAQFALVVPSLNLVVIALTDAPGAKELAKQAAEVMGLAAQIVELAG